MLLFWVASENGNFLSMSPLFSVNYTVISINFQRFNPRNNAPEERLLTIGGTLWIVFGYTTVTRKPGEPGRWQILIMSYYRATQFTRLLIPPSNTTIIPAIYTEKK